MSVDNEQYNVVYNFGVTCDDAPVTMDFLLDTEREYLDKRMEENSYDRLIVHVRGVELLNGLHGMHHSERMDQLFIDGCLKLALATKLCYGREVQITEETSVLEKHKWVTGASQLLPAMMFERVHSKSCHIIMGYTTNINNNVCSRCIKDIG